MDFEERAERRYMAERGRQYHESKRAIPAAAYPWVARLRARKIAPYVKATDAALEYGVGSGWNLAALKCEYKAGFDLAYPELQSLEFGSSFLPLRNLMMPVCNFH